MGYGSILICHFVAQLICIAVTAESVEIDINNACIIVQKHGNGLNKRAQALK